MERTEKTAFVEGIRQRLDNAPFLALLEYKGSTVAQMDQMRRACEPVGIHFQVIKNTLSKRAVEGTDKAALAAHFRGPIAVVFAGEDPIAAAKLIKEQVKANDKLEVKAGFFEGDVLDAKGVEAVASLPSREELLSKLLQTLLAAPRQVMGVIQAPSRDLLYLLKNYETKLSENQ
jgi:large subunit ribosomal protein L10